MSSSRIHSSQARSDGTGSVCNSTTAPSSCYSSCGAKTASRDPFSAGTYVDPSGRATHLAANDFSLTPGEIWTSPETGGRYPIAWTIRVPRLGFESQLTTPRPQQELAEKNGASPAYWEGAIRVAGRMKSTPVEGAGYLEMTGYAGKPPLL